MAKDRRHKCTWTSEEDEFLMDHIGTASFRFIAGKLGRSIKSLETRCVQLGVGDQVDFAGFMTAAELGRVIQKDKSQVIRFINEFGLSAKQAKTRYDNAKKKEYRYMIDPYEFWKWAEKNQEKLNFALIEEDRILPEPEWVEKKRREDYYKPKKTRRRWTEEEKKRAITLLDSGMTRPQVAKELDRTVSSIRWIIDKHLEEMGVK